MLDLVTRTIIGWAMRAHMRAELTIAALTMAIQRKKPPPGLIHHSDRGSQYAGVDYRKVLGAAGMVQSMSRKGNCWDNAPMESCFGMERHGGGYTTPASSAPAMAQIEPRKTPSVRLS